VIASAKGEAALSSTNVEGKPIPDDADARFEAELNADWLS
jgi:hypothetical protein